MYFKKLCLLVFLTVFFTPSQGENAETPESENEFSFYTGTFDKIDKVWSKKN